MNDTSYPQINIPDQMGMLRYYPDLAVEIGDKESIILLQIDWLCQAARKNRQKHNFQSGHWWTYQSVRDWQAKFFKAWGVSTVHRILGKLEDAGLIVVANYNRFKNDETKWYRPDYDKVATLESVEVKNYQEYAPTGDDEVFQNGTGVSQNGTGVSQNGTTLPETPPKTPTEIDNNNGRRNIFQLYENEIGVLSPIISDKLKDADDTYPAEWIGRAVEIAVENDARNWAYIQAILKSWHKIAGENKPREELPSVAVVQRIYKEKSKKGNQNGSQPRQQKSKTAASAPAYQWADPTEYGLPAA